MHPLKRTIDIALGALGTLLLVPLFLILAPIIKLDSAGPALIKIKRVSKSRVIEIYKFRTMVADASALKSKLLHLNKRSDGPFFKAKNDPRITRVGRALRKLHLDEWPQFVNVLRGDLSLVGPRAHEPEEVEQYPSAYQHIPAAIAGLTGFSQINGASSLPFLKELGHDDWYIKNASLRLDLYIIAKTIQRILERRGE